MHPLSSTHSTPDPSRSAGPLFFGTTTATTTAAAPVSATSPHAVNGTTSTPAPFQPLHPAPSASHLPHLNPQRPQQHYGHGHGAGYFDGAFENEGEFAGSGSGSGSGSGGGSVGGGGRRRAYSGESRDGCENGAGQDTEMAEAPAAPAVGGFSGGFTAVNR